MLTSRFRRRLLGGGQGGAFHPRQLPGLVALYDISDLSSLFVERTGASASTPASVDGVVGTVLDLSGNGYHLTAPSDAARPLLKSAGGLFWLQSDGVDDSLINSTGVGSVDDFTVVWGQRETTRKNSTIFNLTSDGDTAANRWLVHSPFGDGNYYADAYNTTSGRISGVWPHAVGTDVVGAFRRTSGALLLRSNGSQLGTASRATTISSDIIQILEHPNATGHRFAGRWYGLILCLASVPLDDAEVWMAGKSGVTL